MSYSNGILGWGASEEKNVEQPEPVFLFTGDLAHDNAKIVKFTSDQENAIMSHSSYFSISNNEIIVNKSGIYEIHFTDSLKSNKRVSVWFRSTNLKDGKQTNQKITNLNTTDNKWYPISLFFVTQLTAGIERPYIRLFLVMEF